MEKKEWFAEWFDSPYYHILYQHRDLSEAERFINNLVNHFSVQEGSHILDLACGKGRHALMLSEKGMNVTGVDLAPNSIKAARQHENKNLHFDVHDMREVYQPDTYDYVLNLFTSFGYFDDQEDNLRVLQGIEKDLKENGIAVIDFMNVNKVINNIVPEETKTLNDITFYIKRKHEQGFIYKNIQFDDQGQHFDYTERVQALFLEDFKKLVSATKLQIINIFGNYELQPFDREQSDRLIIVAKK